MKNPFTKSKKPRDLLSFSKVKPDQDVIAKKIKFINYVGIVGVLILSTYGIINIYIQDYFIGIVEILLALLIVYALRGIKKTGNVDLYSSIGLISIFIISVNNFTGGGFEQTGLFWVYVFPLIVFFLKGTKDGLVWMYSFFATIIVFTVAYFSGYYTLPYSEFTVEMFIISLALITIFVYVYQKAQESSERLVAIKKRDLEKVNVDLINFREAVENSTDGVLFLDQHIDVTYTNKSFIEDTGFGYSEILKQNLGNFFFDKNEYEENIEKKIYLKKFLRVNKAVKTRDGNKVEMEVQVYPVVYAGKLNFYVAIFKKLQKQTSIENQTTKTYSEVQPINQNGGTTEPKQSTTEESTKKRGFHSEL